MTPPWQVIPEREREMHETAYARIGFARWRKNRLFGFRAEGNGVLTLDLGEPSGPCELQLNYRTTTPNGSVRVELPGLDGYSKVESVPLSGDELDAVAAWTRGSRIVPKRGERLLATLHMDSVELYAYGVREAA